MAYIIIHYGRVTFGIRLNGARAVFSEVRTTLFLASLAPMLEKLLWHGSAKGLFEMDRGLSQLLLAAARKSSPEIFSGHYGRRPHKVSAVGFVLAFGLERAQDSDTKFVLSAALLSVLADVRDHEEMYEFSGLDRKLLDIADQVFAQRSTLKDTDGFRVEGAGLRTSANAAPVAPSQVHSSISANRSDVAEKRVPVSDPASQTGRTEQMKKLAAELAAMRSRITK